MNWTDLENTENILLELQKGGRKAMEIMSHICQDAVLSQSVVKWVLNTGGSKEDAKDLLQESLMIFLENIEKGSFQQNSSIRTYILGIVKNLNLKRLRKHKNPPVALPKSDVLIDESANSLSNMMLTEKEEQINRSCQLLMESLSERCRQALQLYHFAKYSMKEVAEEMGFGNVQSAKNHVKRCRDRMRKNGLNHPLINQILENEDLFGS